MIQVEGMMYWIVVISFSTYCQITILYLLFIYIYIEFVSKQFVGTLISKCIVKAHLFAHS